MGLLDRFKSVYSDDVMSSVSVYSPSDPLYERYRDPRVLRMLSRRRGIDVKDLLSGAGSQQEERRGPVYTGRRYLHSNKNSFFDANNLMKQIEDKRAFAELRKKAMEQAANVKTETKKSAVKKEIDQIMD